MIACLRPAEAIMLFGPGEAKGELKKRIERNKLDVRITSFETSDKMTEGQIAQKVRRHYTLARPKRRRDEDLSLPAPGRLTVRPRKRWRSWWQSRSWRKG